jgi:hypothetical protein
MPLGASATARLHICVDGKWLKLDASLHQLQHTNLKAACGTHGGTCLTLGLKYLSSGPTWMLSSPCMAMAAQLLFDELLPSITAPQQCTAATC